MPAKKEHELDTMKRPTSKKPTRGDDCDCCMTFNSDGNKDSDDDRRDGKKDIA